MTSPLVAIIDDEDSLCSSLVDLMRAIGYRAEYYASAETLLTSSNLFSLDSVGAQGLLRKPFEANASLDCVGRSLSGER